ncbi:MarR family winged helix-turn-helix transcriptional regulator [Paraconexibacter algicola]|uniref:MarR family transcriptional regulator n=1 Tax=Paraconexibacter algicola TaxID=2133960 RepID=A0A2T4UM74_9ACTN|nr:MarR family transcriptional regulator [Paraconexibacter algicola]PTL60340.1 MarR family transcriptional regulator [Paraconexibacter algicola]
MAAPPPLTLDEALCFALYSASRAVTTLYRPLLDPLGLTYPQYLVMLALWERDARTVRELADALQLDYGTLSPLLKRLEATGLVERHRRPEDERSVLVQLTAAGQALRESAACVPDRVATAMGLTPGDFERLRGTLQDLARAVREAPAA